MAPRGSLRGGAGNANGFEIRLSPSDMGQLIRDIKAFDGELGKATVRRLRAIATPAKSKVQQRILTGTSHSNTGLRKGLAAGTKVSVRSGGRNAGVSIVTTGAKLPPGKQAMIRAYDKPSLRHPVFGHTDRWVTQKGRPYFGTTLDPIEPLARTEVEHALRDALRTIRAGEVK